MLNSSNPRTSEVASDQKLSLETSKTSEVTSDPRVFRLKCCNFCSEISQVTPKLEVTSDPSRSILHTMAGRLQMLGHRSRKPRIPGFARSGVAVVLRWSGQWSQSMVRSVVWSAGPVGGPVGGPVSGPVGGLVCGLVDCPVCGPVRAVCGPSKHVLLHTPASFKRLDTGQGASVLL